VIGSNDVFQTPPVVGQLRRVCDHPLRDYGSLECSGNVVNVCRLQNPGRSEGGGLPTRGEKTSRSERGIPTRQEKRRGGASAACSASAWEFVFVRLSKVGPSSGGLTINTNSDPNHKPYLYVFVRFKERDQKKIARLRDEGWSGRAADQMGKFRLLAPNRSQTGVLFASGDPGKNALLMSMLLSTRQRSDVAKADAMLVFTTDSSQFPDSWRKIDGLSLDGLGQQCVQPQEADSSRNPHGE
jgi:hypothetical protein